MRVLCTLPNAGEIINGIAFTETEGGMLSEDIGDDMARAFAAIPGYQMVGAPATAPSRLSDESAAPKRGRPRKTSAED